VVKPSFPSQRFEPVFVENLDKSQKELLKKRLRSRSYAYVAQEKAVLAQTPVWDVKTATVCFSILRYAYLCNTQ
jgi:uncharacterized circularly permuted ATP-grasp superfamily protein